MTARRPAAQWAERPAPSWYDTHIWKKGAKGQLRREPLCAVCLDSGIVTAATIADHNPRWTKCAELCFNPLRSVCHRHNMVGQFQCRGYRLDVDRATGYPAAKKHPFWRGSLG